MRCLAIVAALVLTLSASPQLSAQDPSTQPAGEPVSTGQPNLGDFLPDLARNSAGLFSKDNLLPFLVGVGSAAAVYPLDDNLAGYFGGADRLGPLENAGNQGGRAVVVASAVGGLMAIGQLGGDRKFRRFSYDLAQAASLTGLITSGLKVAVGRTRPSSDSQVSFPSGHTSSAFTIATVAAEHYGLPAAIGGYLGATLVGVSRLDAGKHYLSDVVAGAAVGYIVGRTSVRGGDRRYSRLTWLPILSPETRTVGIGVRWNLGE